MLGLISLIECLLCNYFNFILRLEVSSEFVKMEERRGITKSLGSFCDSRNLKLGSLAVQFSVIAEACPFCLGHLPNLVRTK